MKIHLLSDLHMEWGYDYYHKHIPACDVVVLSGDIGKGAQGVVWAQTHLDVPVVYVPGNHEYYRGVFSDVLLEMRKEAMDSNVHVLNRDSVTIENVKFIGATLWTDYDLFGNRKDAMLSAEMWMNDHRLIKHDSKTRPFLPKDALEEHMKSRAFLEAALQTGSKKVVCTHHAPSFKSVKERFAKDALTAAYASHLDEMIETYEPVLWTHGHMHDASDYMIGNTRVVANPHGYPGESGRNGFRQDLVIEI